MSYLKKGLEYEDVLAYSWIQREENVAYILTEQGLRHEALEEILERNIFRHAQTEDNLVIYEGDEFKI